MSVNGIKINGVVEKYEYGSLNNINVQTSHLANGAVTNEKINDGAVTEGKIANGSITADKLANGAATTNKIATKAVTGDKLANGAVTTDKIAHNAVTANNIAPGAVLSGNIRDGAVTETKLGADVVGTLNNKANIDGSYSDMTVGLADQLQSRVGIEDKTPYNFRTSGGSADIGGKERVDAVVGGSLAWNQLLHNEMNSTYWGSTGSASVSFNDDVVTVLASAQFGGLTSKANNYPTIPTGHKVLSLVEVKLSTANGDSVFLTVNSDTINNVRAVATTEWQTLGTITNWDSSRNRFFRLRDKRTANFDSFQVRNCILVDLSVLFGFKIADYIYSLEQANAGAGVAYFRKLFPNPYYAYNAGELLSVKTSAHKMVGFNAYDHTAGKAKVVGGNVYQITGTYTSLTLNDATITPDASGYFTPSENGELTVTGGNSTNTCIHLKWDGERDDEYEAYQEWNYPLDSDLELRGIPKLDVNNKLYYDGDTYEPDGTVNRRYGILNLGEKAWTMTALSGDRSAFTTPYSAWSAMPNCSSAVLTDAINNILERQVVQNASAWGSDVFLFTEAQGVLPANSFAMIFDSSKYASVDAFVSDMVAKNGQLVYAMKVPTTETADPYQQTQKVSDWGTEEYVDSRTIPIPVGHNTFYQANLKAKLEMMPNSPEGDGFYVIKQENNINTYMELFSVLANLIEESRSSNLFYIECESVTWSGNNFTATIKYPDKVRAALTSGKRFLISIENTYNDYELTYYEVNRVFDDDNVQITLGSSYNSTLCEALMTIGESTITLTGSR